MSSNQSRLDAVLEALQPGAQPAVIASAHGISEAELKELIAAYLAGAKSTLTAPARPNQRRFGLYAAVVGVAAISFYSLAAWAQVSCLQTLPNGLKTFCPNAPAIAADVNFNFQKLIDLLGQKTGTVGANAVVMPSTLQTAAGVTVQSGGVTVTAGNIAAQAGSISASANVSAGGAISATGTITSNTGFTTNGTIAGGSLNVVAPVKGSIVAGGTMTCDSTSSSEWSCGAWGGASCYSNCTEGCPAGSTIHLTAAAYCYHTNGSAYCYGWVCVQN